MFAPGRARRVLGDRDTALLRRNFRCRDMLRNSFPRASGAAQGLCYNGAYGLCAATSASALLPAKGLGFPRVRPGLSWPEAIWFLPETTGTELDRAQSGVGEGEGEEAIWPRIRRQHRWWWSHGDAKKMAAAASLAQATAATVEHPSY